MNREGGGKVIRIGLLFSRGTKVAGTKRTLAAGCPVPALFLVLIPRTTTSKTSTIGRQTGRQVTSQGQSSLIKSSKQKTKEADKSQLVVVGYIYTMRRERQNEMKTILSCKRICAFFKSMSSPGVI